MSSPPESGWRAFPPIVSEALVHKFTYWNHQIRTGMRYGAELYTLLQSYPIEERLKACDVACEQTANGIEVCITASKTTYSVWLSLRSLGAVSAHSPQN
ncbi:MAG: hypothetical protein NW220_08950 [Leptolyngbyaceae cyanobacterium bins.349]|nr:hypothetical protein [Leptolyngbyaceae cyanobacterium bins.349]